MLLVTLSNVSDPYIFAQESAVFSKRAVLKQEQVEKAKGKIVIKSICESDTGICECDIALKPPTVKYFPPGYDSVVLDNVNQVSENIMYHDFCVFI